MNRYKAMGERDGFSDVMKSLSQDFREDAKEVLDLFLEAEQHFWGRVRDMSRQDMKTSWEDHHKNETLKLLERAQRIVENLRSDKETESVASVIDSAVNFSELISNLEKSRDWDDARMYLSLVGQAWGKAESKLRMVIESTQAEINASVEVNGILKNFRSNPVVPIQNAQTGDYIMLTQPRVYRIDKMFKNIAHVTVMFSVYESDGEPGSKRKIEFKYDNFRNVHIVDGRDAERLSEIAPLIFKKEKR